MGKAIGIIITSSVIVLVALVLIPRSNLTTELSALPHVESVNSNNAPNPTHRIIHVLDDHFISEVDFVADEGSAEGYERFLDDVQHLQGSQMVFLRHLIKNYGVGAVFVEGVSVTNVNDYRRLVAQEVQGTQAGFCD